MDRRSWILILTLLCLIGCEPKYFDLPQIKEIHQKQRLLKSTYVVMRGETLLQISRRYGCNLRETIARNSLKFPYKLREGQIIVLCNKDIEIVNTDRKYDQNPIKTNSKQDSDKTVLLSDSEQHFSVSWPIAGNLGGNIEKNNYKNNGIDIAADLGTSVLASKTGAVVYSGGGLRGYGHLIIIRHDDDLLTAYANNLKAFVKQGDFVKEGDKIAEVGMARNGIASLHFELRKAGKAINPLVYLAVK